MTSPNNSLDGVKKWWRGQSQNNKLLIGGGAALVLLVAIAVIASGGDNSGGYNPYGQGYAGQAYQGQGYQGGDQGQGYANQGYPGQVGAVGQSGGGQAEGDDPTGYWGRQRSQDQQSRAFSGYVRDTNTVQNNETGEVTTDVPNTYADPAIQSGDYSQVPTSELPTTTPAPAATLRDAPAHAGVNLGFPAETLGAYGLDQPTAAKSKLHFYGKRQCIFDEGWA